ncbi:brefeldin A-inhibited guanine nucleotide-exchange protein 3-like, partial [Parasteatoda tepidariorum]|uniref:brefeldin A-inhibited guanine nucleotide-exchange protein 3-like n=1 Tax=Parasteatoda tepidariorum TaxID=114398 RepID=UPI0039BCB61B
MSAGEFLTVDMWDILCLHLKRACKVSLHSVKQLMVCFHVDSDNFYGDVGEVKVAARKDCSLQECERLRQLSHQVFLLECQQSSVIVKPHCAADDDRSYTFLLFPPGYTQNDPDSAVIRVPFCSLVVGLLSHQILLQT